MILYSFFCVFFVFFLAQMFVNLRNISYLCRVEMKREAPLRTGSTQRSGILSFNLKKIVFYGFEN